MTSDLANLCSQTSGRRASVGAKRRAEPARAQVELELDGWQRRLPGQKRLGREHRVARALQVLPKHADHSGAQPEDRQRPERVRQARHAQLGREPGQRSGESGVHRRREPAKPDTVAQDLRGEEQRLEYDDDDDERGDSVGGGESAAAAAEKEEPVLDRGASEEGREQVHAQEAAIAQRRSGAALRDCRQQGDLRSKTSRRPRVTRGTSGLKLVFYLRAKCRAFGTC